MPDMFRYFKYKGHSALLKNMRRPYLPTQYEKPARGANKFIYIVMAILSVGVLITFVNIYELRSFHETYSVKHIYEPVVEGHGDKMSGAGGGSAASDRPVVWVHGKKLETGYLKHVYTVFERLGYRFGDKSSSWDVLWCHDYPYIELASELSSLKPHQRINHFPGSGFITNKVNLATSTMPFIPKAFKLPGDKQRFLAYAKENPDTKWVQKSNNHRGIKVKSLAELDLEKQGSFVQQFIDNPYLIDGRKFDLAIYTVITSISPLRVYTMDADLLIRFCPEEYYPFSPGIVGKYVIHDEYLPLWKMPSLKEIYGHGSNTFKQTLFSYLRAEGHEPERLLTEMKQIIRHVISEKAALVYKETTKRFSSTRNFFELVRFDFMFDEHLNIYLMEVNMSPNLSSKHFPPNRQLYEHVLFNAFGLVGLTRKTTKNFHFSSDEETDMQVSNRDIQVLTDTCLSQKCADSCQDMECKLCHWCLSVEQKTVLKHAYMEHIDRGSFTRVIPKPMTQSDAWAWKTSPAFSDLRKLTETDHWMTKWFIGKCQQDVRWCT